MGMTAAWIAGVTRGRVEGPEGAGERAFAGLETLELAGPEQLGFAGHTIYSEQIAKSRAGGAIVTEGLKVDRRPEQVIIWVANADLAVAQVLEAVAPPWPAPAAGVHPTAVIDPTAKLGQDVRIGEHVVVQAGAVIGDKVVLMAGVFVGEGAEVGEASYLWPHVTIRERCKVGKRCILHAGVVIGADGFGYRFFQGRHVKIPHVGTAEVGDDCELGANTCVDRGKFSATVVGAGSKVDNLVQIGHNVRLGRHCILVAHTAIGGSTVTGDYLVTGGAAAIADHVRVGTGVQLAAMSALHRDAADGERLAGTPAQRGRDLLAEVRAVHQLPKLLQTVRMLEQRVGELESAAKKHS